MQTNLEQSVGELGRGVRALPQLIMVLNVELGTPVEQSKMSSTMEEGISWGCRIDWEEEVAVVMGEVIL
jgi:hypothetical protein